MAQRGLRLFLYIAQMLYQFGFYLLRLAKPGVPIGHDNFGLGQVGGDGSEFGQQTLQAGHTLQGILAGLLGADLIGAVLEILQPSR